MKYKSPISIRVGERTELDLKFAQWIEGLPDDAVLSNEIKQCCIKGVETEKEESELQTLKQKIENQEIKLRELETKIKAGVTIEKAEEEETETSNTIDEEKMRQVQELAASMTDW